MGLGTPEDRPPAQPEFIPIDQAPPRIRREYLLRERRNNAIAITVIVVVVATLIWGGYLLLR